MGVRGLARYSHQQEARASRVVSPLSDVTLAVDFVGFQFFVCQEVARQVEAESALPVAQWLLLGGCPIRLEQYVEAWLQRLEAARIQLLFVSDPPQCFLGVGHTKTLELQDRAQQKLTKLRELNQALFETTTSVHESMEAGGARVVTTTAQLRTDKKDLTTFLQDAQSCFPFSREKLRSVLRRHGARIVTATKEADEVLAQLVREGKAYAVVANDSDFLVMRGVQYIPFSKLRMDDRRAGVVSARVFSPELLAATLEIEAHHLVDLALLCTNDFTQQLDVEFQFAQVMHFPRSATNRSSDDAITPELASLWIRGQQSSMLDDPRVRALYAAHGAAFANVLGAFYEFYGYGAEFRQRYPFEDDRRRMAAAEMHKYKKLLDQHEYSSSLIDVLHSRTRRLKQQFDIFAATGAHPGKTMLQLLSPVRAILYQALDVKSVRESFYDQLRGHHKQQDVAVASSVSLKKFLASTPIANRPQLRVEQAWRSLVFKLLYDNEVGLENASFLWTLLGKQSVVFKSVVSALLVLKKCDTMHLPEDSRIVTMERLEVLLLTALICVSLKDDRVPPPYDLDQNDLGIEWEVYASVGAFVEILRTIHLVRAVLGEKVPPLASTCPSLFSAEIFVPVYAIVRSTRPSDRVNDPSGGRALSRAQVDSVLCYYVADMKDDERTTKWDQFCQMRAVLNRLVELLPDAAEAEPPNSIVEVTSPVVANQGAVMRPKLLVPSSIITSHDRTAPIHQAAKTSSSTPSSVSSSSKKKAKKKGTTPRKNAKSQASVSETIAAGKLVRAEPVNVSHPLNPSAQEFQVPVAPPLPPGPPPPLPPIGKKAARALKKQQAAASQKSNETAVESHVGDSNGRRSQGAGADKAALLTPASVAKRFGKTSSSSKRKNSQQHLSYQPVSNGNQTLTQQASNQNSTQHESNQSNSLQGLLQRLPVYNHRHEILKNVASNQLTIIQGETGCGKSTSVPQFILDEWMRNSDTTRPVNIYVTQPRRIAAIELAKTVAKMREENEFGEDGEVGKVVGYRIGQKHCTSSKTKITYVTTGYMVERLIHDPEALQSMTHLVIDEVHERSMDVDSLLLLLKLQLKNHENLRIIIMSATMDAKVLIKYFTKAMASKLVRKQPLFVGTKLFPVQNLHIEDMTHMYPHIAHAQRNEFMRIHTELQKVSSKGASANSELGQSIIQNVHESQLRLVPTLVQQLIMEHHQHVHLGAMPQCILVFLPGIGSINRLYEELGVHFHEYWNGVAVSISVLHSSLELEQQQVAFATIGGKSTKIVLATNLAESSVTIPDVTHVINCGMEKQIQMPNARSTHAEVLVDVWCSRASVLQRSGRAGRLMPGTAFHLFSQDFQAGCMAEFTTPEILRKPLDRIVLQMKGKLHEFGVPSELLKQALDAPDLNHIDGAYKLLAHFDAIDSEDEDKAQITSFGSFVCHMPLSMELCRLILMGKNLVGGAYSSQSQAYLLANIVIVVSILASPDLFVMPSWFHLQSPSKYMAEMKQNLKAKFAVDAGVWSEPLAVWRFYISLLSEHSLTKRVNVFDRLKKHSISTRRYQTMNLLISDTCERLIALSRQGSIELDPSCMQMLFRLDNYASSQRVDKDLLAFAKSALAQEQHDLEVLRFLVVHNYSDRLITGRLIEGTHFDDDDDDVIAATDRIDLSMGKEDAKVFFSLDNTERKKILGQLAGSDEDFTNIAYSNNEVSLYSKAIVASQPSGDSSSATETGYDRILPRLSFPVSLAYYIRDPKFPVDFGRTNAEGKEEKLRFRVSDSSGSNISWLQAKDGVRVSIGGRSLFSLPVRAPPTTKLMAVYADRLFTGDETRMFCSKCTLLPPDVVAYQAVLLLATVRKNANVWVQVDTRSEDIVAVKIDKQLVAMPEKTALRREVVDMVNVVREGLSSALQCSPASTSSGDAATTQLLPVDSIVTMCRDDHVLVRLTKEQARGRRYDWQQLTMATPTVGERAELRERGLTPPRFPPLL